MSDEEFKGFVVKDEEEIKETRRITKQYLLKLRSLRETESKFQNTINAARLEFSQQVQGLKDVQVEELKEILFRKWKPKLDKCRHAYKKALDMEGSLFDLPSVKRINEAFKAKYGSLP